MSTTSAKIPAHNSRSLRIAVLGAGASGIMALIKLREAGFADAECFEKAATLGGTWRDNRYPGVACDVPAHAYRYSFAPNADWSRTFAPGAEILDYFRTIAQQYDVERSIRYENEVIRAAFHEGRWQIETTQGNQGEFDVVLTATGVLHHPVVPQFRDHESFRGLSFHTSRWPDGLELAGKRVGLIGTGSTGTQITSTIAEDVGHLTLFQRTPQWILPLPNRPIPPETRQAYLANPELVELEYRRLTERHNAEFAAAVVGENPASYAKLAQACEEYLETVRDPELRRRLTPDYKVGCKRLVMSGTFYEAVQRPNVSLVTEGIDRFTPEGIMTEDGAHHPLDVAVIATGFDTHRFFRPMRVAGLDGRTLDEVWADGNQAYLTVTVPGFPNWFMIGGPNSPIGNFPWLQTSEAQFGYALQLIRRLAAKDAVALSPKPEASEAFNRALQEQLPQTIWATGCRSWYMDSRGRIASWPWTFERFIEDLRVPRWEDFETHS